jgi:hypothetical protein
VGKMPEDKIVIPPFDEREIESLRGREKFVKYGPGRRGDRHFDGINPSLISDVPAGNVC